MTTGDLIEQNNVDRAILALGGNRQRFALWQLSRVNWQAIGIAATYDGILRALGLITPDGVKAHFQ